MRSSRHRTSIKGTECDNYSEATHRDFLRTLGLGSVVGIAFPPSHLPSFTGVGASTSRVAGDDYLFSSGLVYFGTATLGPCSRKVVEATTRAWYELETNPSLMGSGDGLRSLPQSPHAATRRTCSDVLALPRSSCQPRHRRSRVSPGEEILLVGPCNRALQIYAMSSDEQALRLLLLWLHFRCLKRQRALAKEPLMSHHQWRPSE